MVKISDFGLTKNLHEIDYYKIKDDQKALPIRWMSLEALQQNVYSIQSDVVSKLTNYLKKKVISLVSLFVIFEIHFSGLFEFFCGKFLAFVDIHPYEWHPYEGLKNQDIGNFLQGGNRLEQPVLAPEYM